MNPEDRFKPVGRTVLRRIGPERILVPISGDAAHRNAVFPLNETAELVWGQIAQGRPLREAAEALAAEFDVDAEQALADCARYAAELESEGLIQRGSP